MIFAFLFGLSMDYEVFMLTRMREAYDETGSTDKAIELGLARTGKLVTSAALILMFAFLVLSTSPGYEVKSLAIGLAAGIIFDATVIRALLVPALMRLLGDANWWMPDWTRIALRLPAAEPAPEVAVRAPSPSVDYDVARDAAVQRRAGRRHRRYGGRFNGAEGGVPSREMNPCMCAAGAFRGSAASMTIARRRARPRTSAALRPAAPAPRSRRHTWWCTWRQRCTSAVRISTFRCRFREPGSVAPRGTRRRFRTA